MYLKHQCNMKTEIKFYDRPTEMLMRRIAKTNHVIDIRGNGWQQITDKDGKPKWFISVSVYIER